MFSTVSNIHPSLLFRQGLVELLIRLYSEVNLRVLTTNIKLRPNWLTVTNTLAYCNKENITADKSFIVEAPGILKSKFESCLNLEIAKVLNECLCLTLRAKKLPWPLL